MANPVKIKATVRDVIHHTDEVASFRFVPQGRVPKFFAGQFLHLALDAYDPSSQWPESRVFSIASSPAERREELAITISAKGRYTKRILAELAEGSECWLKLPYGSFLFPADAALVLVAGGVGITPYLSLLREMLEKESKQKITLYYGFRRAEHYLFADLLSACVAALPNFSAVLYSEEDRADARSGILDIHAIAKESSSDALYYLSGPPGMIAGFKGALLEKGIPAEQIYVDDWE